MIKSDSDSKISENADPNSSSMWGSFSGSFFEAGTVGQPGPQLVPGAEPVSHQPTRSSLDEGVPQPVTSSPAVVTSAPISSSILATPPVSVSGECVAPSSSSVLGGEEGLTSSWEDEEKFSTSRLVVTDRESTNSPDSPSVELVSPSDQHSNPSNTSLSSTTSQELQSVDLASSCVSQSSIDVISPSSVELISPSDVEVISPEPYPEKEQPALATLVSVEASLDLDSSMSSDRTVIDCQDAQDQDQGQGDMQDLLEEAMVDAEKKSETSSSRSSEIVKVESLPVSEVTSCDELEGGADVDNCTTNSSDIEVISSPGLGGGRQHVRNTSDQSSTQGESGEMAVRLQGAIEQAKVERGRCEEMKSEVRGLENKVSVGQGEVLRLEKEVAKLNHALKEVGGDDKEKDEVIEDLRSEGEALARQNGKQAEVIRKLRSKEKSHDGEVSKLKTELEKNVVEVERLRKSLAAKNNLEGSQSEAIKTLTEANQAWEGENKKMKNELEDNVEKVVGLRSSLESAYREMAEMKRKLEEAAGEAAAAALSKEVSLREEAVASP